MTELLEALAARKALRENGLYRRKPTALGFSFNMVKLILTSLVFTSLLSAETYFIGSKSGANLRDQPDLSGKKLLTIPFGTKVEGTLTDRADWVEDFRGEWVKINFRGKEGYALNVYLLPMPLPETKCTDLVCYEAQFRRQAETDKEIAQLMTAHLETTPTIADICTKKRLLTVTKKLNLKEVNYGQVATLARLLYGKDFPTMLRARKIGPPGSTAADNPFEYSKRSGKRLRKIYVSTSGDGISEEEQIPNGCAQ